MKIKERPFLTSEEIAGILCISINTLHSRRWRKASCIPVYKQGRYLFAKKNQFWKWYNDRKVICA